MPHNGEGIQPEKALRLAEMIDSDVTALIAEEYGDISKRHRQTLQLRVMGFSVTEIARFFGTYRNDVYRVIRGLRRKYCRNSL